MPDTSEPQPVLGLPIAESALPLNKARRIYDMGAQLRPLIYKRGEDTLDWFIDLIKLLEPDDEIVGVQATCSPGDMLIQRLFYADTGVVVWLTGGDNGVRHTVKVTVTTLRGVVKLFEFVVLTRGQNAVTNPPPTVITISIDSITVVLNNAPPPDPDPDPDPEGITWLRADGGVLRDENDAIWRPKLINWYGFEQIFMPGGLWGRPYKTVTVGGVVHEGLMDQAKRLGFNGFIITVCQDVTWPGTKPVTSFGQWNSTYIHPDLNPDLFVTPPEPGVSPQPVKPCIQILDAIGAHAKALGMRIFLRLHCLAPDDDNVLGTGGKWYTTATPDGTGATTGARREPRSEAQSIGTLVDLAYRYRNDPTFPGYDIINEPHACTWGDGNPLLDVKAFYERAGEAIHAVNDKALIVCQGVAGNVDFAQEGEDGSEGQFTWGTIWSGNLTGVRDHPVTLTVPNRVVYSPHEYGSQYPGSPAIAHQWFEDPRFPEYMRHVWDVQWGYIPQEDRGPLIIGEVGAEITVGVNAYTAEQRALDFQWLTMLGNYSREFSIGFAWWALNPGGYPSGLLNQTTGGVWTEAPADKMTFVRLLLDDANPTPSLGALTLSQGGGLLLSGTTGYLLVSGG